MRLVVRDAAEADIAGATGSGVRNGGWTYPRGRCIPSPAGYTQGMKTAISIPEDVYADAERLARELNKSRSRLYSDAVREYVARHSAEGITEALDRLCDEVECRSEFVGAAARRALERSDW